MVDCINKSRQKNFIWTDPGFLDCEQSHIFLLSHSWRARVKRSELLFDPRLHDLQLVVLERPTCLKEISPPVEVNRGFTVTFQP